MSVDEAECSRYLLGSRFFNFIFRHCVSIVLFRNHLYAVGSTDFSEQLCERNVLGFVERVVSALSLRCLCVVSALSLR